MGNEPLIVLHVEDNPDHASLVARGLRRHPMRNTICHLEDGEAALDYLFRRGRFRDVQKSPRPHVLILDLCLPKVSGLEVLRIVKTTAHLRAIPVVILTSSDAERDLTMACEYHANSYLVKPLDFDRLSNMIEQLGFYWLGCNRCLGPRGWRSPRPLQTVSVEGEP